MTETSLASLCMPVQRWRWTYTAMHAGATMRGQHHCTHWCDNEDKPTLPYMLAWQWQACTAMHAGMTTTGPHCCACQCNNERTTDCHAHWHNSLEVSLSPGKSMSGHACWQWQWTEQGPFSDPCLTFFVQNRCPADHAHWCDDQDECRGLLPLLPTSHRWDRGWGGWQMKHWCLIHLKTSLTSSTVRPDNSATPKICKNSSMGTSLLRGGWCHSFSFFISIYLLPPFTLSNSDTLQHTPYVQFM